jgi:predicted methyltransferase
MGLTKIGTRKVHNVLYNVYCTSNFIRMIETQRLRLPRLIACMEKQKREPHKTL